jgi:transcriptional regulator with XRE-family HTH domain
MGDRLRRARRAAGLTQRALAALAGVTHPGIRFIEREGRVPRVDITERFARALGVPAGWLAFGAELPFVPADALGCAGMAGRLSALRAARGLSTRALGAAAGLASGTVVYVENGQVLPTLDTAERLAVALGVTPWWLAFGEGVEGPPG